MDKNAFSYSGTELVALSGARNYYRWIFSCLTPHLGARIVEVGSGVGTFSNLLLNHGNLEQLILVEPAANLFPVLRDRYSGESRVKLVHGYLEDVPMTVAADCVILINVLEHIADVEGFLAAVHARLVPAGRLLVLVPAGPKLFGTLDEAFGHHRRYTKYTLAQSLEKGGFRVTGLRYFNLPGVLTWFIAGRVLRKRTLLPRDVRIYDQWVVPWISALESVWVPPCGQSLIAVTEKRTEKMQGSAKQ